MSSTCSTEIRMFPSGSLSFISYKSLFRWNLVLLQSYVFSQDFLQTSCLNFSRIISPKLYEEFWSVARITIGFWRASNTSRFPLKDISLSEDLVLWIMLISDSFWDSLEKFHTASHFVGSPSSASAAGKSFSLKLSKNLDKLGELIG